jgi:hypothetical protein
LLNPGDLLFEPVAARLRPIGESKEPPMEQTMEQTSSTPLLRRTGLYLAEVAASIAVLGIVIAAIDGIGHLLDRFGLDSKPADYGLITLAIIAVVIFCAVVWPLTWNFLKELWFAWRSRA